MKLLGAHNLKIEMYQEFRYLCLAENNWISFVYTIFNSWGCLFIRFSLTHNIVKQCELKKKYFGTKYNSQKHRLYESEQHHKKK